METETLGYETGEVCNRDGCIGVIAEHDKERGCSCHINPPCSSCVDDRHFCPICEWEGVEDQRGYGSATPEQAAAYKKQNDEWNEQRDSFYRKYNGKEPVEKLEIRIEGHTHFSQKVIGVFPVGTETRETIRPKVIGSFGGRFDRFNETNFEYIAYTD